MWHYLLLQEININIKKKRKQEKLYLRKWLNLTKLLCKILYQFHGHCLASSAFWGFKIFSYLPLCFPTIALTAISPPSCGALREKCPNTEFFWSVFFCIWTWKNSVFGYFSCSGGKKLKTLKDCIRDVLDWKTLRGS